MNKVLKIVFKTSVSEPKKSRSS